MSKMDRRQLGKGLGSGVAAVLLGGGTRLAASVAGDAQAPTVGWTEVFAGVWRCTIGVPEVVTPVKTRLVAPMADALKRMPVARRPPLASVRGDVNARGTRLALPLDGGEDIYGFGLQFFSLKHRAKKHTMRVNADPKADTGDSHAPVPFYVSNRGYGVLVDTARYATFYCGGARDKPEISTGVTDQGSVPMSTEALYAKSLMLDQASEVLVDVPAQGVDVYLFAGPAMLDAVRRYNLFSGGGVVPPDWGLGFWYRTSSNASDKQVTELMTEFRTRKIPCDVVGLEAGWQTHAYSCTFAWHRERFPDPAGFVKAMNAKDLHVNLWEHAFTHPSSPLFPSLRTLSGDKGVWGGLVPDFGDPEARRTFGEYHGRTFLDIGVDGFKIDECDNSDYTGGWSFPELSRFPSGADGEQMHSLFGLRYQAAIWDQYRQRKKPTYNLVRSSGALAAPYPFVLYSDLYDHRQFVRALVNASFSGLLWCPEVRDAKSEEDLLRRLQTVVFSPLAMINGWYIVNPPWKQLNRKRNNANDLTPGWETLESRCREILQWRMQLVPYLAAAFERYAADGTPPFRALALDWPDRPELSGIDDAWMVGDRMLVAPLFAGESGRKVTLPPGTWHDYWTGAALTGGSVLEIAASESKIPVYVKGGSVIPLASVTNSVADPASRHLAVKVYGDGRLPFEMVSADGSSLELTWRDGQGKVRRAGQTKYGVMSWSIA
jgi:alpha-D-xyloside xylohydrolase